MIELTITQWAAWAEGLHTQDAWMAWAQQPHAPSGSTMPVLEEVPAMQRRRIERSGRMAVQAAWWCSAAESDGIPLIFASRHGDVQRSCELLTQLASGEAMSPTQFGLSVHNAIAALYSILRGERGNYLALAAGRATVEAAWVEAAGLLADGAPEVQLVVYEAALPAAYAEFADEADAAYAWSVRLRAGPAEGPRFSLAWQPAHTPESATATPLPAGLEAFRFLLAGTPSRQHRTDGLCWHWQRLPA